MSLLFEPFKIGKMELSNRSVRSATNDGGADEEGRVQKAQVSIYTKLARSGVGLIITGTTNVQTSGQIIVNQKRITDDKHIEGLRKLTKTVHREGGKIAIQLFHGGIYANSYAVGRGFKAVGPSFIDNDPNFPFNEVEYEEADDERIQAISKAFAQGARRAIMSEFDAIQLHGAHGYLFSQFLSPYFNRRNDRWGGSLENRLRFHQSVYREIRRQVGPDYPIMIKLGVKDFIPGGLKLEEGIASAKKLSDWGFDAIEVSSGMPGQGYKETEYRTGINNVVQEAYHRNWSRKIRSEVKSPLILSGGLRTFDLMEEILKQGDADLVAFSRPLIREPHLIQRWRLGNRAPSACISCNQCLDALISGRMSFCQHLNEQCE